MCNHYDAGKRVREGSHDYFTIAELCNVHYTLYNVYSVHCVHSSCIKGYPTTSIYENNVLKCLLESDFLAS